MSDASPRFTHGLYAETATAPVTAPRLQGDAEADVAVVGGGYTGLSTALHLAERGIRTIVLEAEEPGFGASGRHGGHVNPGVYPDPGTVIAALGEAQGRALLEASSSAPDFTFDLIKRLGIACEAEQTGTLRAGYHDNWLPGLRATLGQLERTGSPARWIDRAELEAVTGTPRYLGGIFYPQGGKLNPLSYARGLAKAAIAAGASVHGGSRAVAVKRAGDRWRVSTRSGSVTARHVVLATNGYTDGLWPGLGRSVVPVFSMIAATEPLPLDLRSKIMPGGSVLYESGLNTVYYRVDAGGRLLIGGRGAQRDVRATADARHLIDYAKRIWPMLQHVRWTHAWNGKVAVTADKMIHLHEPAPGVIAALGYNGRGVAMATVMGAAIARRIAGEAAEDLPLPVTQVMPFPFRSFAKIGVQVRLVYGRVRDRLGM